MNEGEVQKQLSQMVAFIKSEAEEKANEIMSKAQEEFSIEKARIVQAEKRKIMQEYERREKQVEIQKKIAASNELNQSRLKILKSRDDAVQGVIGEAHTRLKVLTQNPEQYKHLLKALIVQSLLKLSEPDVQVRCRRSDQALVSAVLNEALREYQSKSGKTCALALDSVHFLPPGPEEAQSGEAICSGGIMLSIADGKIVCSNTLDARLALAFEQQLPVIRTTLFGRSQTRVWLN